MRQLLYVSESLVGLDLDALDRLTQQARINNALDGVTGLLWTDGKRFAQVLEGDESAVAEVMAKISGDPRHRAIEIVQDQSVDQRQFGDWSMVRPATEPLAQPYEGQMRRKLARVGSDLSRVFDRIVEGSQARAA